MSSNSQTQKHNFLTMLRNLLGQCIGFWGDFVLFGGFLVLVSFLWGQGHSFCWVGFFCFYKRESLTYSNCLWLYPIFLVLREADVLSTTIPPQYLPLAIFIWYKQIRSIWNIQDKMIFGHTKLQLNTRAEITYPAWPKSCPNTYTQPTPILYLKQSPWTSKSIFRILLPEVKMYGILKV